MSDETKLPPREVVFTRSRIRCGTFLGDLNRLGLAPQYEDNEDGTYKLTIQPKLDATPENV